MLVQLLWMVAALARICEGISSVTFTESNLCGDWTPYKDEKCLKIVDRAGFQTQEDAEVVCQAFAADLPGASKLLTIKSKEEQEFVQWFLFVKNEVVDNVWLGLSKKGSLFVWNDGSELAFNNWANQTLYDEQHECVQMESGDGAVMAGLWLKVSCKRKNAVVCERKPSWTLETLQNSFFNFKLQQDMKQKEWEQNFEQSQKKIGEWEEKFEQSQKKIGEWEEKFEQSQKKIGEWEEKFEQSQKKIGEWEEKFEQSQKKIREWEEKFKQSEQINEGSRQEIKYLKSNPVPIGFIYIELPNQPFPTTLWPTTTWMDVSSNYSGLFFRVVGGQAAPFGQTQDENSPRLAEVETILNYKNTNVSIPSDGRWSQQVYTGTYNLGGEHRSLRFRLLASEVRPRNQAVRIWKRIH